jgi:hypothetical protein
MIRLNRSSRRKSIEVVLSSARINIVHVTWWARVGKAKSALERITLVSAA